MFSKFCALCEAPITEENDSREHLISNAIGGRRKISGFICRPCNTKSGDAWDAQLADQLNPLSLHFGISRERGGVPSQDFETTGGNKIALHEDGSMSLTKPKYEEIVTESGINVSINARSTEEAKKMLAGLKGKYPQISLDAALNAMVTKSTYLDDPVKFSIPFAGPLAGRSLVKTALGLAVASGIDPFSCKVARDYLLGEDNKACFGHYYEKDLLKSRPDGVVFHCVAVSGDPRTKQLLGYVEYFGALRIIVCLSKDYTGGYFNNTYAIDPISGKEIDLEVDLSLSPEDIAATIRHEKIPDGAVAAAFGKVIPIALQRAHEQEKNRVINEAIEYAFEKCGIKEGDTLTPEKIESVPKFIVEKLQPFLLRKDSNVRNS